MDISTPVLLVAGGNALAWIIQLVVLKTDLKWIKERLRAGDKRLERHGRLLHSHSKKIASVQSACSTRHGTIFPVSTNPGIEEDVEGGSGA